LFPAGVSRFSARPIGKLGARRDYAEPLLVVEYLLEGSGITVLKARRVVVLAKPRGGVGILFEIVPRVALSGGIMES
jgi:hypothetical protein